MLGQFRICRLRNHLQAGSRQSDWRRPAVAPNFRPVGDGYVIEERDDGRWLVVTGGWSERIAEALVAGTVERLDLNFSYSSGKNAKPCSRAYASASDRRTGSGHCSDWIGSRLLPLYVSTQTGPIGSPLGSAASHFQ